MTVKTLSLVFAAVLALGASGAQADADTTVKMEKYTQPGSAIVYRRPVAIQAPAPAAAIAEVPAAKQSEVDEVKMEKYTKPGSAIVYRRPVTTVAQ